ncbi:MAG: two-component system, cell cycle sensor histidine kinase and response regulator CckA [Gaiellaceae bacterium]|nr:two-component system, cell cycle sensor histidine kinase and response regulator CckA [Gaiellaceae bacterium]
MSAPPRIQILLVEDDPDDVLLITEALRETRLDTDLHVAVDGEEAMAFFHRQGRFEAVPVPDLVLLDLNLPKVDGRQVLVEIKADPRLRRIPVIVLTTSAAQRDVVSAYDKHVNAYVRKPLGYDALLDVVRSIEDFWMGAALLPPRQLVDPSGPGERLHEDRLPPSRQLEALGRVTVGVAHDFNNLLTAIRGYADLGAAAARDEATAHFFAEINSAGQRAGELTRQLLQFGRRQDVSPTALDLNEVVDGLHSLLRHVLPTAIELRLELSARPVLVLADRPQIEQALLNLVVNSRDAIDGEGSITVTTTEADGSSLLQVRDTGSGIAEAMLPHIFDPFFSTKATDAGTGLGLATVHATVSQSGGTVFAESTSGLGTTMTIALPASVPPGPAPACLLHSSAAGTETSTEVPPDPVLRSA